MFRQESGLVDQLDGGPLPRPHSIGPRPDAGQDRWPPRSRCGSYRHPRRWSRQSRTAPCPRPAIRIAHDPEADVWSVEESDLPGVSVEAPTADALIARLPVIVADLRDEDDPVPVVIVTG
ncbi:DUF1902 domain-containing protein [Methylobacterium terricola]